MTAGARPTASIVIPAHQEEAVIGRCLTSLLRGSEPGEFEVVVAANACTDGTADIARGFGNQVQLVELDVPSKTAALNAGDAVVSAFPRLYVDADVELSSEAVQAVVAVLDDPQPLLATPRRELQLRDATFLTRCYYRAWEALQAARGETIGTGVYAMNRAGRERFAEFPDVIGDDRYVHDHFRRDERRAVDVPVKVWPPQHLRELVQARSRVVLGNWSQPAGVARRDRAPFGDQLRRLARDPLATAALPVYVVVTVLIRRRARVRLRSADTSWSRAARVVP